MVEPGARRELHSINRFVALTATVFIAYFVAGRLGQATTSIRSGNLGPVWPAYGVALAATLWYGRRAWLGIFASAFIVAFFSPIAAVAAAAQAAGATLAAVTGAWVLRDIVRFDSSLSRLRDALGLIVFGALGSALISATIGVAVLYATHVQAYSGLGAGWLIYWLGDSTGVLLTTPLILTGYAGLALGSRSRVAELAALLLSLALTSYIIFGDLPLIPVKLHVLAFAVLPFVIWAAIRFGVAGVCWSTFCIATIATVETAYGSGPFAQNAPFTNAVLLDVFFAVLSVSGLTLAAVIAERERAEHDRERLVREQASFEARLRLATIVESSDDAIVAEDVGGKITDWNKGAERLYGYPAREAIGKPFPLLVTSDLALDHGVARDHRSPVNHYHTVHQRQDGSRIEVSLTTSPIYDATGRCIGASTIARDVTERKRAAEALRQSEDQLRLILDSTAEAIFGIDRDCRCTFCNPATLRLLKYDRVDDLLGKNMHSLMHHSRASGEPFPAEECRVLEVFRTGLGIHVDDEVLWRADGSSFPAEYWCHPQRRGQDLVGVVIAFVDITERKLAEEALSSVSRRLIDAQERERTRIARELHDDIVQRLALLAVGLDQLQQHWSELPPGLQRRLSELRNQTAEITIDVQSLSHELHSSKLQYLGLAAAMKGFCEEFGQQRRVNVDFTSQDLPTQVPPDISLCLFRVLQEALRNSEKHSKVRRFEVALWGAASEVQLRVSDGGAGFYPDAAAGRGLGLVSMQERLQLVKGTLSIQSQPGRGTTIHARVPFSSSGDTMRAAG